MKTAKRFSFYTLMFLLVYSIFTFMEDGHGSAFGSTFSGPYSSIPHVRILGLFDLQEGDTENVGHYNRLTFSIGGEERLFLVHDIVNLTGTGRGFGVLSRINSKRVVLVGPEELLGRLNSFAASDQSLVIEGRLYYSSGRLLLTGVKADPEEEVTD